jgi:hypothetical protein
LLRFALCFVFTLSLGACFTAAPDPEELFLTACDAAIQDRLKSPASYNRISHTPIARTPFSAEAELERQDGLPHLSGARASPKEKDLKRALMEIWQGQEDRGDLIHSTIVTVDAANAYGVNLRQRFLCEFVDANTGLPDSADAYRNVMIDGQTTFEWAIARR